MNWDAIGAIGEIIGASAVVVSLVYLATQIRVQNTESRIAGNHAILEGFRNSIAELASPNFSDISYRCMKSVDPLTGQELMQTFAVYQQMLRVWEEAYGLWEGGRQDSELWVGMESQYVSFLGHAGIQHVWEMRKEFYSSKFQRYVEALPQTEYKLNETDA